MGTVNASRCVGMTRLLIRFTQPLLHPTRNYAKPFQKGGHMLSDILINFTHAAVVVYDMSLCVGAPRKKA